MLILSIIKIYTVTYISAMGSQITIKSLDKLNSDQFLAAVEAGLHSFTLHKWSPRCFVSYFVVLCPPQQLGAAKM